MRLSTLPGILFSYTAAVEAEEIVLPVITVTTTPASVREAQDGAFAANPGTIYLSQEDMAIAHERTVDEVLRGLPGLGITKGGTFGAGWLQVRGVSGQGLLTLDGLPISDSLPGIVNLNALLPDGLESIDVKRGFGPASRPFSALGGSIDMTSRTARDDSADVRVEGGTFGFLKETLRGNLIGRKARIAVTANRSDAFDGAHHAQESNGNTERDPFHGTQTLMKAGLDLSDRLLWEGSLFYRDSMNAIDGRLGIRGDALIPVDEKGAFFHEESWMAQNALKARLSDSWLSSLQLGYTHHRNRSTTQGIEPGYTADLYLVRWQNDQRLWQDADSNALHLLWGAEGRHENAEAPTFMPIAPGVILHGPTFAEERSQQAGFMETRFVYNRLSGNVGVRYESYSRFDSHALFHAEAAWELNPRWQLHAKGGNGFRIPSYAEKLFPLLGNPSLRPERGAGGDLGLEWRPTRQTKLDLTGFYNRYDDLILVSWNTIPSATIPCLGQCVSNLPNASVAGLEVSVDVTVNDQWRGGLSYTYTDSRNLDTSLAVPFRAKDSVRAFGEWRLPALPLTLWVEGVYRGQSYNDINNRFKLDDAFRLNLHARYRVTTRFDLYVRGENLTNNRTPDFYGLDSAGAAVYGGAVWTL